jgi:hypothetical protein
MSSARRLRQLTQLSGRECADLMLAAVELALANRRLASRSSGRLESKSKNSSDKQKALSPDHSLMIARIAWALPKVAALVPWRADCLRQAEAGQRWLLRHDIVAEIRLGVRRDAAGAPEMHAWLIVADQVLTGGEIASYEPFRESGHPCRRHSEHP